MIEEDLQYKNRFQNLRRQKKFVDCSFKVDDEVIFCHKIILVASSPVFETMFYGGNFKESLKESADFDNNAAINVTDISFSTFNFMLDFIYTGELNLTDQNGSENDEEETIIENLLQICYCSEKYLIEELKKQCMIKLSTILTKSNVLKIFQKSFDSQLDDFCVNCLYFIQNEMMRNGNSFSNLIFNDSENHLSHNCFGFLVKNLLDISDCCDIDLLLCFIKSWCFMEFKTNDKLHELNDENLRELLEEFDLDESTINGVINICAISSESGVQSLDRQFLKTFNRQYYKPVRPVIVENEMEYLTFISFKRFVILRELSVNSRLIPETQDIFDMLNRTYAESIFITISLKNNPKNIIYSQFCNIPDVSYNSSFKIRFDKKLVLFPNYVYSIKFSFSEDAVGFEYPRCIFSLKENEDKPSVDNNPRSIVQFHEYFCEPIEFGSIIEGISYNLFT